MSAFWAGVAYAYSRCGWGDHAVVAATLSAHLAFEENPELRVKEDEVEGDHAQA